MPLYLNVFIARLFVIEASHHNKLWKFLFFEIEATNWGFALYLFERVMATPEMRVRLLRRPAGFEPVESSAPHGPPPSHGAVQGARVTKS